MKADRLLERFEAKMAVPGPDRLLSIESGLAAVAAVYGGAMALRAEFYRRRVFSSRRLSCPVVSVGNLTIGGTGKTPMVVYLARRLLECGRRPAVVSRGYRGAMEKFGGVVSDGRRILLPAEAAGDEPWMIASLLEGVPVVVGKDRWRAGQLAQRAFAPDVVLLDDGFQHLRLQRDLDILLFDATDPFENGRVFPRGRLREPIRAAGRADAIVLTRSSKADDPLPAVLEKSPALAGKPIFRAAHVARLRGVVSAGAGFREDQMPGQPETLEAKHIFAFSGIARNESFHRSIRELGGRLVDARGFPDHHRYPAAERFELDRAAKRTGADLMATTEKDFARLGGQNPFSTALAVVGVDICLVSDPKRLDRLLSVRIDRYRRD